MASTLRCTEYPLVYWYNRDIAPVRAISRVVYLKTNICMIRPENDLKNACVRVFSE